MTHPVGALTRGDNPPKFLYWVNKSTGELRKVEIDSQTPLTARWFNSARGFSFTNYFHAYAYSLKRKEIHQMHLHPADLP